MADLYFAGFETGDKQELVENKAEFSAQTSIVRSGVYALKGSASSTVSAIAVQGLSATTIYARFGLYIDKKSTPGSDDNGTVFGFYTAAASLVAAVRVRPLADGTLDIYFDNAVGSTNTGFLNHITAAGWHLIETKLVISATVGVLELKMDGSVVGNTLSSQNTGSTAIGLVTVATGPASANSYDPYFDDIRLSDSAYLGDGKILAFQGKSGSPTYTAFTKTGGAAIETVWSETPFSATNEAHSTAQNQAQTMLVSSTANGGATIGASDTINACQQKIVAKLLAGTNLRTYNMRRRIGGADTDTSITTTLTASDQLISGPIFTTTLANLGTAEIGAQRGATSANSKELQVEDMWLMVDYTPAAGRTTKNTRAFPLGMEIGMNWVNSAGV